MKLINDNFDDYFESNAPKKDNTPHEETEEEREERELMENTIERRSKKKRIAIFVGSLILLLLIILFVNIRYFKVYQESTTKGRVADIALRGTVFQTYEGVIMQYDIKAQDMFETKEFKFSVTEDSIYNKLVELKQNPTPVMLKYKEYRTSVPWRGETKYLVYDIDTVTNPAYVSGFKRITTVP